jgi:hypothetical protein
MSFAETPALPGSTDHSILDDEKDAIRPASINSLDQEERQQKEPVTSEQGNEADDDRAYANGVELYLIVLGLCISVLLVGLVRSPFASIC